MAPMFHSLVGDSKTTTQVKIYGVSVYDNVDETSMFWKNWVNIMVADAMVPCMAMQSAALVLCKKYIFKHVSPNHQAFDWISKKFK